MNMGDANPSDQSRWLILFWIIELEGKSSYVDSTKGTLPS